MNSPQHKIGFVSLGCPKATVDSEQIITQLRAEGYQIVADQQQADMVIINTCGFIDSAVEESMQSIDEALHENGKVIVTGCLGAKSDQVSAAFPELLAVTGPHATAEVMQAVHQHLPAAHDPFLDLVPPQGIKLTPRHYAYLKISEGCNHRCSFCIIPHLRGDLVSRPIDEVMQEAQNLVQAGVRELLVISQDTSAYGVDLKYTTRFWQGQPWQTRFVDLARVLERIQRWREICPELVIRSTFIVGFPGETEEDFQQLLDFLTEAQLDRVGCFMYSAVEGAPANALADPVDETTKQQRYQRFMLHQQAISTARLQQRVGQTMTILVESAYDQGWIGRSYADAPEIDGEVFIETDQTLEPGQFVEVKITASDEYDLFAELL